MPQLDGTGVKLSVNESFGVSRLVVVPVDGAQQIRMAAPVYGKGAEQDIADPGAFPAGRRDAIVSTPQRSDHRAEGTGEPENRQEVTNCAHRYPLVEVGMLGLVCISDPRVVQRYQLPVGAEAWGPGGSRLVVVV